MDCGFSAFIGKGNNWCSPYKSECIHKLMGDPFPFNESFVESEPKKKYQKKNMGKRGFCFFRTRENTLNIGALKRIKS